VVATLILPLLVGALLGARFRVLILFPVTGAVVVIALLAIFAGANDLSAIAINAVLAVVCIQLGYFAGMLASGLSSGQAVQANISRSA
jgi:hypothetical protein